MLAFAVALTVMLEPSASQAQGTNILPNGGFEGGYFNQDGIPEIAVPNGFKMHWLDNESFTNSAGLAFRPETVVWNIADAPVWEQDLFWRDGIYNLKIFKGGAPVYAALSTDVNVIKGARYRYTVPIWVDIVNGYTNQGEKIAPGDPTWGGVRLGASVQGATWRDAGQINYTPWFNSDNTPGFYLNMLDYTIEFTATSDRMTLWAEMYGSQPLPNNGFFLDGLSLVQVSIPPTATPVWPTATPTQPWPTRTPTPWPTRTPIPPTSTPIPTATNTPIPTNTPTPTITPTPLPTGPWFTPTPTVDFEATRRAQQPTPAPVVVVPAGGASASDGGQAVAAVAVPAAPSGPVEGTFVQDGVIYATVGANDSVWSIAAKNGLTLDEILTLNNLPENEVIFVKQGDNLIVGYEEQPEAVEESSEEAAEGDSAETDSAEAADTAGGGEGASDEAAATAEDGAAEGEAAEAATAEEPEVVEEPEPPTATPEPTATPALAQLCLKAFDDANQNSAHDAGEALRGNVAFTVLNGEAVVSNYISDGQTETYCIRGLEAGAYRITRSKLENETLTTSGEVAVSLTEGAVVDALFGSYIEEPVVEVAEVSESSADVALSDSAETTAEEATVATQSSNPMNAILIAVAVAAALLLIAILVILLSRRSN